MRHPLHLRQVDAFLDHLVERRHLAETPHDFRELVDHVIDFLFGREPAQAETNRRVSQIIACTGRMSVPVAMQLVPTRIGNCPALNSLTSCFGSLSWNWEGSLSLLAFVTPP